MTISIGIGVYQECVLADAGKAGIGGGINVRRIAKIAYRMTRRRARGLCRSTFGAS
jgi:hypothetical protein